ncbi:hypothetical protein LTR17_018345 [Elasticomyces elasticus]|nr:hypothetical protein LTR17_018345 [Elasticomyces elasticus]
MRITVNEVRKAANRLLLNAFKADSKRYVRRIQETFRMGPEYQKPVLPAGREANTKRFKHRLYTMLLALRNTIRNDFQTPAMAITVKAALKNAGADKIVDAVLPDFREDAVHAFGAERVTPETLMEITRVDDPKAYTECGVYIDVVRGPTGTPPCTFCEQPPKEPVITSCLHAYCKSCLDYLEQVAADKVQDKAPCMKCGDAYTSVTPCEDQEELDARTRQPRKSRTPVAREGKGAWRLYGGLGTASIGILRRLKKYVCLLEEGGRLKGEGLHTHKVSEPGVEVNFRMV